MKTNSIYKIFSSLSLAAVLIGTAPFCQLNGMKMPAKRVAPVTLECSICYSDTLDWERLSCGHIFCKACLKRIVDNAVREKSTRNLVCPATNPRCARALSLDEVRAITDNDGAITNWHASILDREILIREHGGQPCLGRPGRNCNAVLMRATPQEARIARCDGCERRYCNACFLPEEIHRGANCAQAQERYAQSSEATPEERATLALVQNNSKKCPRCNNAVEKNGGCNHMTCRCGHEFCWLCLADWRTHRQCTQAPQAGWAAPVAAPAQALAPATIPVPAPQPGLVPAQVAAVPPNQLGLVDALAVRLREPIDYINRQIDLQSEAELELLRQREREIERQREQARNRRLWGEAAVNPDHGPRPDGENDNLAPIAPPVGAALWIKYAGRNALAETTAALLTGYLMSQELDSQKKKGDLALRRSMYLPALFVSNACLHMLYPRRAVLGSDQFYTALASWAVGIPAGICLPKILSYFSGKKQVRQVQPLQPNSKPVKAASKPPKPYTPPAEPSYKPVKQSVKPS